MTEPRPTVTIRMTHRIDTPGLPPLFLRPSPTQDESAVVEAARRRGVPSVVHYAPPPERGQRDEFVFWRVVDE